MGESSITIADVRYIIDFCLTKFLEKDPVTNLTQLKLKWASTDMCDQRKGRAGRTQPGVCFRLIKKDFFRNNLLKHIPPEIERCPLEDCVLLGKSVYPDLNPHKFLSNACAVPKGKDIDQAIKSLKELGALTLTMERKGDESQQHEEVTSEDMKEELKIYDFVQKSIFDILSKFEIQIVFYFGRNFRHIAFFNSV